MHFSSIHLSFIGVQLSNDVTDHHSIRNHCFTTLNEIQTNEIGNDERQGGNIFACKNQDNNCFSGRQNNKSGKGLLSHMNIFDDHIDIGDSISDKDEQQHTQHQEAFSSKCLIDTNLMHFSMSNNDEENQSQEKNVDRSSKSQEKFAAPTIKMQSYALSNNNGNGSGSL